MTDLTVEVINKLSELIPATVLSVGDRKYTTNEIYEIPIPTASPYKVFSLNSIIDYVKSNPDNLICKGVNQIPEIIINVNSHKSVMVTGLLNNSKKRDVYLTADLECNLRLNSYMELEDFILMLQTSFVPDDTQRRLLKLTSHLTDDLIKTSKDDGVSQTVVVKSGITKLENTEIPNPVTLVPFRTFPEIGQPEGKFIFRAQKGNYGPQLGLFDCDSNEWKLRTIDKIKEYLRENLKSTIII